ncbi:MAG: hypothetical protein ACRD45_02200 [Bryobacteraceae bacterium]
MYENDVIHISAWRQKEDDICSLVLRCYIAAVLGGIVAIPAFSQVDTNIGQTDYAPLGGAPSQVTGPPFRRLDLSLFKQFHITERIHAEFRAEMFNVTNTANFANPSHLNFDNVTNFGQITATRDSPNDPREIQFGFKLYW